jgi:signal transduction histidine kinase
VEAALHDVRSLGRGTPPRMLIHHGLRAALAFAGRDAPLPTTVAVGTLGRYRPEVEAAAYFCCLEALQNASKHARGASAVRVTLDEVARRLRLEDADDGEGFDPDAMAVGAGRSNLRERVAAVDGRVTVAATPGRGTRVSATTPV